MSLPGSGKKAAKTLGPQKLQERARKAVETREKNRKLKKLGLLKERLRKSIKDAKSAD